MPTLPRLSQRAVTSYNRLGKEVAALNYALRIAKPAGVAGEITLGNLNSVMNRANQLFRRHRDLPYFIPVNIDKPMSQLDLTILVARLSAACTHFEQRYAHLMEGAPRPAPTDPGATP